MRSPTSLVNLVIVGSVAAAVLWASMASWFTAHNIIGTFAEINSYFWSCCVVIVGGFLCFLKGFRKSIGIIGTTAALLTIVTSCRYSDHTFIFWKIKAIQPATWNQMISDLRSLDEKRLKGRADSIHFSYDSMPSSLRALGLPGDCGGVYADYEGRPDVMGGVKSRRWGLAIGSNNFSRGDWISFNRVQVGDDAWFFAGPSD
jgi:hypothetical protein